MHSLIKTSKHSCTSLTHYRHFRDADHHTWHVFGLRRKPDNPEETPEGQEEHTDSNPKSCRHKANMLPAKPPCLPRRAIHVVVNTAAARMVTVS